MPIYEIVKPYNHEVKVGDRFETEKLHPSLMPHVKLVSGSVKELVKSAQKDKTETSSQKPSKPAPSKPVTELTTAEKRKAALEARKRADAGQGDEDKDEDDSVLTAEQLEALHDEALAEDAERFPVDGE